MYLICLLWLIALGGLTFYEVKRGGLYLGERECAGEAMEGEEGGKPVVRMQYTRKNN